MATIDHLPPEVLQEIFTYICSKYSPSYYVLNVNRYEPDGCVAPYQHQLLQVSRRWNAIASSSTWLWSTICVTASGTPVPTELTDFNNALWFLRLALRRSKRALLDLDLRLIDSPDLWAAIAPAILSESHRWSSFVLGVDDLSNFAEFASLRGRLPNLQNLQLLELNSYDGHKPELNDAVSQMVEGAPKLRQLACCFHHLDIKFRWDQIQELVLEIPEPKLQIPFWNQFRQVAASTSLVKLTLEWDTHQPIGMYMPVRCPSVQEFAQPFSHKWPTLLDLPALRKTSVEAYTHLPAFTRCIQRNNCVLTTLEMSVGFQVALIPGHSDFSELIADLYANLPHVTSLTLLLEERIPHLSVNSISCLLPIISPSTLPSLAVLRVQWRPGNIVLDAIAMAPLFLILTKIIKSHRPALILVCFGYEGLVTVDWAAVETLEAFVDLESCEEIFRTNCWIYDTYGTLKMRKYEYSLMRVNSA